MIRIKSPEGKVLHFANQAQLEKYRARLIRQNDKDDREISVLKKRVEFLRALKDDLNRISGGASGDDGLENQKIMNYFIWTPTTPPTL